LLGLIGRLFARVSRDQYCFHSRSFTPGILNYLEASVLLFERVVTEQKVELMLIEYVPGLYRGDRRLHRIALLLENKGIRGENGSLVIDYQNPELALTPHYE
jgi:hypothetical protein